MSSRLTRIVCQVVLLGAGLQGGALLLEGGRGALLPREDLWFVGALSSAWLLVALLVLTMVANLVAVPVRRGEQIEELTLFEAAVVIDVLLLPARHALWLPVAAVALSCLLTRRDPLKSVFNVGNLAASTALLVVAVHTLAQPGEGLTGRTVLALVAGLCVFTLGNLLNLARVLAAVTEVDPRQVVQDGVRLAVLTTAGTVSIAGTAVLSGALAPALLPFAVVPAVALVFAFRARAQESEERERSGRLLALSHVLAGRRDTELLPSFLTLCRQAFDADTALVVLQGSGDSAAPWTLLDEREDGLARRPADHYERELLRSSAAQTAAHPLVGVLPAGWRRGLVAPLEAEGRHLGVLVLVSRSGRRRLAGSELTLLAPLASALAAALQGAEHLRQLTEETSKLQAVVDQSSDGILVLDGTGTVLLWSPALTTLTGRTEAEALAQPLSSVVHTAEPDGSACDPFAAGRELLTPESPQATVELVLLRHDGEQRVVRCAHAGVFTGDALVRDVVIVHDITRERQVERLKADFIATVSHELRTPVTPIKGYADLLRRRGDEMTKERRDECLEVIGDRCDHLARLVEDLLLASRISATEGSATAQVDLGEGDLVGLVHRAAADFGAEGSRVRLTLPSDPVRVSCDPMRVIQVLTNLIGNALKYSAAGSPVSVRLVVDGPQAYVDVVDQGRGIPADQLERVFEKFHRVEDPMRMTTGGTGLGLYIARQLATAMGGTLACASTLGVGSVFRFGLRRAAAPAVEVLAVSPAVPHPVVPIPVSLEAGQITRTGGVPAPRAAPNQQGADTGHRTT